MRKSWTRMARRGALPCCAALLVAAGVARAQEEAADPPEVAIGERLFLETRFAEFFARFLEDTPGAGVNDPLPSGDPALDTTETTGDPLPGPFAGQSMNCRSCHLVDEQLEEPGGGMRTYNDFARRSPVPDRGDGLATSARNAPPLVNASLPRPGGVILHFDGEFPTLERLVQGTIAGRNYGWLPGERSRAVAHAARVIREDDGSGELAQEFGGAYRDVLAGAGGVPAELQLPPGLRIDVDAASDQQLFDAVAELIAAYVAQLEFERDEGGANVGSPYDRFLKRNGLPRAPGSEESVEHYAKRLRKAVKRLRHPRFVDDGPFAFHDQEQSFGPTELAGLRIFLREPGHKRSRRARHGGGVGNCAACHPAPNFTDFGFHNTGVTQVEYDAAHRSGAFRRLYVPNLSRRRRHPDRWLPATERHPDAEEPFRRPADAANARYADLGVWNIFANPDFPESQQKLTRALCQEELAGAPRRARRSFLGVALLCNQHRLLRESLARFKTAGLRDLGHSAPYFHTGQFDTLTDVLRFYAQVSQLARRGKLRNGDPEIARIAIVEADFAPLAAFLRSLNEDYE